MSLVDFLKKASDAYYNGEPIIDDATYDAALDKLKKQDPNNPYLKKIGKDSSKEFKKREHLMSMTSQQKAANSEEFIKWYKKGYSKDFVVNHKLDGLSVELQYKEGKFKYAVTRGDGKIGDDISKNVKKMRGFVDEIEDYTGSIRGEIVMTQKVFDKKYKPKGHKMPRTMAAGLTKRPDGVGCEDLHIVVYDMIGPTTEKEKIEFLQKYFDVAETRYCKGSKEVLRWYQELIDGERDSLSIGIDGLVIKCNEVDLEDMKRAKPNRQIALKFPSRETTSRLLKVVWNVSGINYTPVAHIEPIEIDGSTISKASLANPNIMKALGLKIGSIVTVSKRKDIIPKIESVIEIGDGDDIEIPTVCVNCGEKLICDSTLYCPNDDCANKLLHQLQKWIDTLDIKDFGKELIKNIYNNQLVKSITDLYNLTVDDIKDLVTSGGKKVGEKNALKALTNLKAKKEISLEKFIAGFDITGIGEKNIEVLIAQGYDSLEKIRNFEPVKGFGDVRSENLREGLVKWRKDMNKMAKIIKITVEKASTNISVCFTGKLNMSRKEAEALVKTKGGSCKSGVVKGLTYLVTDNPESGSAKNEKAKKDGVKIISEAEFLSLFQ